MSCSRLRTRASIHSPAAAPRCSRRPRARRSPTASFRARNGSRSIAKPTGSACRRPARPAARPARAAGRDGRIPDVHPARLSPRPQRAGRDAGPDGNGDERLRRLEEHRRRPAAARQHPARKDALADGHAVHLADRVELWLRRSRGHRRVRARVPRSRRADPDVAVVRRDRHADPRRGERAGRAGLAVSDRPHVRGLRAEAAGARAAGRPGTAGRAVPDPAPKAKRSSSGRRRVRVGRIGYINCAPVYGAIDRGVVQLPAGSELVTGTPAELNDLLIAGALGVSVISAIEYARHAKELVLLPDLAISCDGPVRSVALFAKQAVGRLGGSTILLSASSRTSVALLELLCRDVWKITPKFADARAEAQDLDALAALPHEAVLVIGD